MTTSLTTRRRHWGTELPRSDPSSHPPVVLHPGGVPHPYQNRPETAVTNGHPQAARTASDLGTRRLTPARNGLPSPGYPRWDARSGRKIGGGRCPLTPTGAGKILPLPRRTQGWSRRSRPPAGQPSPVTGPRHRSGQGSLPRGRRGPSYRVSSRVAGRAGTGRPFRSLCAQRPPRPPFTGGPPVATRSGRRGCTMTPGWVLPCSCTLSAWSSGSALAVGAGLPMTRRWKVRNPAWASHGAGQSQQQIEPEARHLAAPLRPGAGNHTRPIPPGLPPHRTRHQHPGTDRESGRTRWPRRASVTPLTSSIAGGSAFQ